MALIWNIFDLLFTLKLPGESYKISFSTYLNHMYKYMYFAHPIDFFALGPTNFEKKWIYQVWFLFGVIPGVDSYSRYFETINK